MARWLLLGVCAIAGSGCFTLRYLGQAAAGQFELVHGAVPLSKVVNDPHQPRRTRYLLAQVKVIKAWGQTKGLKPTNNYRRYSDLHRSAAVWVVQGCAPLKFEVRRWEFPIAGTVPYLGFFDEAAAHRYAEQLGKDEGLDVAVRGAGAYSTLGWFEDPVLSTMLAPGPEAIGELAETILHESVHATVYLAGQSSFDESLASFVAEGLTPEWLAERYGADGPPKRAYTAAQARYEFWALRLHRTYDTLDAVYRSNRSDDAKRAEKQRVLTELQAELGSKRALNNAALAGSRTYSSSKAGFERLRAACGSWSRTLDAVRTLKPSDFARPQQEDFDPVLDALAKRACPAHGGPSAG